MLVGRSRELELLLERIAERRPVALLGEAGIGKTALLAAASKSAGCTVHAGGALRALSWLPYLPLERALRERMPVGDALALADHVIERVDAGLLVLDDLQWADRETLDLLPLLAGRISVAAALRRGDSGASQAGEAMQAADFELVPLGPLRVEEAHALLADRRPQLDDAERASVLRAAHGSPLLLEELTPSGSVPATLAASLRARLDGVSVSAREAMAILGLLGRPAEPTLFSRWLPELAEAGLVHEEDGRIAPRHALLAEAAAAALPPEERRALHARLARAVADPGEAARQHAEAGEEKEAYQKALVAAHSAARPGERARHLALAASLAPPGRAGDDLRVRAAAALYEAADYGEAERLASVVALDDPLLRAEAAFQRGRALWSLARADEAEAVLQAALGEVSGTHSPTELRLQLELLGIDLHQGRLKGVIPSARRALALAHKIGEEQGRAHLLLSRALNWAEGSAEALEHSRAGSAWAERAGDGALSLYADVNTAVTLLLQLETQAARSLFARSARRARRQGLRGWELDCRWYWASFTSQSCGRYRSAIPVLRARLRQPSFAHLDPEQIHADLALALADTGEIAEARRIIAEVLPTAATDWGTAVLLYSKIETEWLAGQSRRAFKAIEERNTSVRDEEDLARVAAIRDYVLFDLGRPPGPPAPVPKLARGRLFVLESEALAALAGDGSALEAERLLVDAASRWQGHGLRYELRCRWAAGEAALRAGAPERARVHLLEAEARAAAEGMIPLVSRIRRSLRKAGVQRTAKAVRNGGPLTMREHEVVCLAGDGLTSAEIGARLGIAASTVDSAAKSAMRKLGTASRRQAAALLVENRGALLKPLIVATSARAAAAACSDAAGQGYSVERGWLLPHSPWDLSARRIVCSGSVSSADEASAALMAATRGAGIIAEAREDLTDLDGFVDALGRLGHVEVRADVVDPLHALSLDERRLLELVAEGLSVAQAARRLAVSRRTAERRLAHAREILQVRTTAETVVLLRSSTFSAR